MGLGGDTSCPEEANRLRQVPGRHLGRLPAAANSLRSRLAMRRPGGLSSLSTSHRRQPRRQRETVLFETTLAGKHQGFPTPLPTHGKRGGIRETPGRGWNRLPTHTHTHTPRCRPGRRRDCKTDLPATAAPGLRLLLRAALGLGGACAALIGGS